MTETEIVEFKKDNKMEFLLRQHQAKMSDGLFQYILTKWFNGERITLPVYFTYPYGTVEWITKYINGQEIIGQTHNSHNGCINGCKNCYACNLCFQNNWEWWKWYGFKIKRKQNWIVNWRKKPDGYTFMYPSMHDTFEHTVDDANKVIGNMLKANAYVLFVSKPILKVTKIMLDYLEENFPNLMHKVTMRYSITTPNDKECKFWEGNASLYDERKKCLELVYKSYCESSVSAERFLKTNTNSIEGTIEMVKGLLKYTNKTLWLGKMNHIPKPDKNGDRHLLGKKLTDFEIKKFQELEEYYNFDNIFKLVRLFWNNPKVMWKESIKKVMIAHIKKNPQYTSNQY